MTDSPSNRPVALLIEDNPELIRSKQNLFTVSGFQAICVSTASEALREFIATPAVDIVIADVNLDERDETDVSGINVAAMIREMRPDLPIVGVSAKLDSLPEEQKRPFTSTLVKGKRLTSRDYNDNIERWLQAANDYRVRRSMSGIRAVQAIEAIEAGEPIDYEVVREFLPGRQPMTTGTARSPSSAEDVLRSAGWWLQLIQAGDPIGGDELSPRTRLAVLVWVRDDGSGHTSVLHGFSSVSAPGSSAEQAVRDLFRIMRAYHRGQVAFPDDVGAGERARLIEYLRTVFE